jgi:hypothetical protein
MTIIPLGPVSVTFECEGCGPTSIVLSNGDTDDSVASCSKCGAELGPWPDVRQNATMKAARPVIAKAADKLVRDAIGRMKFSKGISIK